MLLDCLVVYCLTECFKAGIHIESIEDADFIKCIIFVPDANRLCLVVFFIV